MSQSHFYKFSDDDGSLDPKALEAAIAKLKVGEPSSHGGVFHDISQEKRQYDSFNIHTPPDITPKTRIIAVCGAMQGDSDPGQDGWFVSDFFAFYHLLHGLTPNQCWMHCLDLGALIDKYRPYLHGNPFKVRKIVLDHKILKNATDLVRTSSAGGLRLAFEKKLRSECQAANKAGDEPVLVLMFGHGNAETGGVILGTQTFKQDQFSKAIANTNVSLTIISTACFSGGWSCNKQFDKSKKLHYNKSGQQFDKTTLMAAGPTTASHSWNYTATFGRRACGSMFTTAIIEAMVKVAPDAKPLVDPVSGEEDLTEEQEASFEEFTRTVYETLLKDVDRRGMEHQFVFSAENDAWDMCWRERTGLPLAKYKARWEKLEDHPADPHLHPGDPLNRDPFVSKEQEAEYIALKAADKGKSLYGHKTASAGEPSNTVGPSVLGKRKISPLCGGSIQALIRQVSELGAQYRASYKGFDESGQDGAMHNLVTRVMAGEVADLDTILKCQRSLDYRMNQMITADKYLEVMKIPKPHGQLCHEFNTKGIEQGIKNYDAMRAAVARHEVLFPVPVSEQGRQFSKGRNYLIAAIHFANLDSKTTEQKLDTLAKWVGREVDYQKEIIKRDPEVRSKRQKLFSTFGINLGNVSPAKRRSRGQSLGQKSPKKT